MVLYIRYSMKSTPLLCLFSLFIWHQALITTVLNLDYLINFGSGLRLRNSIQLIARKSTTSYDSVYFLFDDKSIAKYSNDLIEISSFSFGKKNLSMFGVCSFYPNSEVYYGIVENKTSEILVGSSSKKSEIMSIKNFTHLKHVEILIFSNNQLFDMFIYRDDQFFRLVNNNGTVSTLNSTNFTRNSTVKNSVSKVLKTIFNRYDYNIVFTSLNHVYAIKYNASSYFAAIKSIAKVKDLSLVQNLTLISTLIDNWEIIVVQFSNFELYAFHMVNGSQVPINSNVQTAIGTSILKAIYPGVTSVGARTFMLDDKSIRVNFDSNGYSYVQLVQNYTLKNFTGVFPMNLNYSFVYTLLSPQIYFLNAIAPQSNVTANSTNNQTNSNNMMNTSNRPIVLTPSCQIQSCQICDFSLTKCLTCFPGYWQFQGVCYVIRNCSTLDCAICDSSDLCLECNAGFALDDVTKVCTFNESATPNQVPTVNNSDTVYQQNDTLTDQSNQAIPLTNNQSETQGSFSSERLEQTFDSFPLQIKHLNVISSRINSLPAARILLTFFNPLFGFFDDYWYYIYHEDSYPQLQIIPQFLVFMYYANNQRIFSSYLKFDSPVNIDRITNSNFTPFTNPQIYQINHQETYFLGNIQEMLFQQYLLLAVLFFIVKFFAFILKFLLKKLTKKPTARKTSIILKPNDSKYTQRWKMLKKTRSIHHQHQKPPQEPVQPKLMTLIQISANYLQNLGSFKSILLTFVGSNLIFIAFNFSVQLRISSFFTKMDIVNLVSTFIFGFVLFGSTVFIFLYVDVFSELKPEEYQNTKKLKQSEYVKQKQDCLYNTYFLHIKSLAYGFIHGFFCQKPFVQYALLILTKIFLLYVLLSKKQVVRNGAVKGIVFTYFTAGIGVDLLCLLSKTIKIPQFMLVSVANDLDLINLIELIFIGMIVVSLLLQLAIEMYLDVKSAFCSDQPDKISGNQNKPKTMLMFLRRIAPDSIFKSKNERQNQDHQSSIKRHQNQYFFTAKLRQNLNNKLSLEKMFKQNKFKKRINNDNNKNQKQEQIQYLNKLKNVKRTRATPLIHALNDQLSISFKKKTSPKSIVHWQEQTFADGELIKKPHKNLKEFNIQIKKKYEKTSQTTVKDGTNDKLSQIKRIKISSFFKSKDGQEKALTSKKDQIVRQEIHERGKYTMGQQYMLQRKNIKEKDAIKNRIKIQQLSNENRFIQNV